MTIPKGGAEGVIATIGGRFGGYALYLSRSFNWWFQKALLQKIGLGLLGLGLLLGFLRSGSKFARGLAYFGAAWVAVVFVVAHLGLGRGKPVFLYNFLDLEWFKWEGPSLSPGTHTVTFDFKYDGPGPAKGGTGILSVDGKEVDKKSIKHTIPLLMSIDETFDVGSDTRTSVDDRAYQIPFTFTGTIDTLPAARHSLPLAPAAAYRPVVLDFRLSTFCFRQFFTGHSLLAPFLNMLFLTQHHNAP